jgi:hypothetical protein
MTLSISPTSEGDGFNVTCDCTVVTKVLLYDEFVVVTERMPGIGEFAVRCDGCRRLHRFTIKVEEP